MLSLEELPTSFVKTFIRHLTILRYTGIDIFPKPKENMKNYARFIFLLVLYLPMITGQILYIILCNRTGATFLEVANAVPSTLMILQDGVKLLVLLYRRNKMRGVIVGMAELWPTQTQSEKTMNTLKKWIKRLKSLDDVFFVYVLVSLSIFELSPLFLTIRDMYNDPENFKYQLPLQLYFWYWIDSLFEYAIAFVCLNLSSILTHLTLYVSLDFLLVSLTFDLCALFNILREDLEEALANYDTNVPETLNNVNLIVTRHQKLLWLSEELNNIFSLLIFVHVSFSSVVICCFGFLTVVSDGMLIRNLTATAGIMFAIWNLCWPGQFLADSSFGISEAAYGSEWYNKDTKLRKYIVIIMNRAQKPCYLTALGFSDLTLANFSKVLSTSWSYLSLLNQMYKDSEA